MATDLDRFDFVSAMRVYALPYRALGVADPERFPKEWVTRMCHNAAGLVFASTNAEYRLKRGKLSEDTFMYVCCQMVLRVMRYSPLSGETNGSYTWSGKDDQSNPPGYDASPNLYVSKAEKALLDGASSDRGPVGTIGMDLNRVYGM